MPRRKSFSKKERDRLFVLYDGECHICTGPIRREVEAYEIEHVIPWALTQDDSDDNLRLAHVKCHRVKTTSDVKTIAKTERMRLRHIGALPRSKRPIPSRSFPKTRDLPR